MSPSPEAASNSKVFGALDGIINPVFDLFEAINNGTAFEGDGDGYNYDDFIDDLTNLVDESHVTPTRNVSKASRRKSSSRRDVSAHRKHSRLSTDEASQVDDQKDKPICPKSILRGSSYLDRLGVRVPVPKVDLSIAPAKSSRSGSKKMPTSTYTSTSYNRDVVASGESFSDDSSSCRDGEDYAEVGREANWSMRFPKLSFIRKRAMDADDDTDRMVANFNGGKTGRVPRSDTAPEVRNPPASLSSRVVSSRQCLRDDSCSRDGEVPEVESSVVTAMPSLSESKKMPASTKRLTSSNGDVVASAQSLRDDSLCCRDGEERARVGRETKWTMHLKKLSLLRCRAMDADDDAERMVANFNREKTGANTAAVALLGGPLRDEIAASAKLTPYKDDKDMAVALLVTNTVKGGKTTNAHLVRDHLGVDISGNARVAMPANQKAVTLLAMNIPIVSPQRGKKNGATTLFGKDATNHDQVQRRLLKTGAKNTKLRVKNVFRKDNAIHTYSRL